MIQILLITILLLSTTYSSAQEIEFVQKVKPAAPLSPNILFLVDASSSITWDDESLRKFDFAWRTIASMLGGDELYFSAITFNDKGNEQQRPWEKMGWGHFENVNLSGRKDFYQWVFVPKQFEYVRKWVLENTGTRSYGEFALYKAITDMNPLIKNRIMRKTLTVILITDGGFTEAADKPKGTGNFISIYKSILTAQEFRKKMGLVPASLLVIGMENKNWSLTVKRPDNECQDFLKHIGKKFGGGYYLVREKKEKKEEKSKE